MIDRLEVPRSGATRFHVFVPAIMSAGLVFSLFTLLRDALARVRDGSAGRAEQVAGHATAAAIRSGSTSSASLTRALRPRTFYSLGAITLLAVALEVLIGATANYFRPGGYAENEAIVWALALLVGGGLAAAGGTCAALLVTWPHPPAWARLALTRTPLGRRPDADPPDLLRLVLGWAALVTAATTALLAMIVALSPHVVRGLDQELANSAANWNWPETLPLDLLGDTRVALTLALFVGVATLRCPAFALAYLASVATAMASYNLLKHAVGRPRPIDDPSIVAESFPSGHLVQATLIVGLVPVAVALLARRWAAGWWVAVPLGAGLVATALYRVHIRTHWPSDVVAGILLGAALVLGTHWALRHPRWHAHCHNCLWLPQAHHRARHSGHGLFELNQPAVAAVRLGTRAWTGVVLATFFVLALTVGIPRNPEGEGWLATFEAPIQLGFLALAAIGWLIAFRWEGVGALILGLAGTGLGVLAGVGHPPLVAALLMVAFWAPAVAYWLVWQQRRSHRAIALLALTTAASLLIGWTGAARAYDHFFGPAHPESRLTALPVDRVEWVWSGGVGPHGFRVAAHVDDDARQALLEVTPRSAPGTVTRTAPVAVPETGVVSWTLGGLVPNTQYDYAVVTDGRRDRTRGLGSVHTFPTGAASFTIAVGGCARTGSNGAVYDAIRDTNPLMYFVSGDLHYGNLDSQDPADFREMYDRVLTAASQAALYRQTPVTYVWDDHDYGPNDGDASSPSRRAATTAYRQVVPHGPLAVPDSDGAIYQAYSIGRVRFVLTDTRSHRTAASMLGEAQTAWLERELTTAARSHKLVVWVNPDPWIAPASPGSDHWGGYAEDRRRIATTIERAGIDNLVMLAGDAHMVGLDDGTNSGYGPSGKGFPVLHAAALDRPGSVKGGPYSEGAYPGAGQFGVLRVIDDGGKGITVELSGQDWTGRVLVSRAFRMD